MPNHLKKILEGYHLFRDKYATGDATVMQYLSHYGQEPEMMVVACCDSRVDPALILQCDPGDLFVVRNVANIVPPYEKDEMHHGTSAALEFGVCFLKVKHLILLGHSQCGGVQALLNKKNNFPNDFISNWVSLIESPQTESHQQDDQQDDYAKLALRKSHQNCLSFPWIRDKVKQHELQIHLWFFDIKSGQIFNFVDGENQFKPLI
jgi:carbonic anhydrase